MMKRTIHNIIIYFYLPSHRVGSSCTKDLSNKILDLLDRVTTAENMVHSTNVSINTLYNTVKALEQNDHISGISEIKENGGCRLCYKLYKWILCQCLQRTRWYNPGYRHPAKYDKRLLLLTIKPVHPALPG